MDVIRARRRGFTLVELLTVVAVIGLLLAILVPALGQAGKAAQSVKCLSNMRQLFLGWNMYADAYDDRIVAHKPPNLPGGTANPRNHYEIGNGKKFRPPWIAMMGHFVGIFPFSNPSTTDSRQDYEGDLFVCPAAPERIDERNHCWGYNYQFLGNARLRPNGKYTNWPVKRTSLIAPANTVLCADAMGTAAGIAESMRTAYQNNGTTYTSVGNHAYTLDPPRLTSQSDMGTGDPGPNARSAVDARHGHRANVLFIDGHGDPMSPYDLGYRMDPDGKFLLGTESGSDPPTNALFSGAGIDRDPPPRSL